MCVTCGFLELGRMATQQSPPCQPQPVQSLSSGPSLYGFASIPSQMITDEYTNSLGNLNKHIQAKPPPELSNYKM